METEFGNFILQATKIDPHWIEWEIVQICGRDAETGEPVFFDEGQIVPLNLAEVYARGTVKWDGCSDWDLMTDDCAKHFCDPEDMQAMADVLKECYRLTSEMCEKWDG